MLRGEHFAAGESPRARRGGDDRGAGGTNGGIEEGTECRGRYDINAGRAPNHAGRPALWLLYDNNAGHTPDHAGRPALWLLNDINAGRTALRAPRPALMSFLPAALGPSLKCRSFSAQASVEGVRNPSRAGEVPSAGAGSPSGSLTRGTGPGRRRRAGRPRAPGRGRPRARRSPARARCPTRRDRPRRTRPRDRERGPAAAVRPPRAGARRRGTT